MIDTPAVRDAALLVREVDERSHVGLEHIVIDDWNLEDRHLDEWGAEARAEHDELAIRCADVLRKLTAAERHSALALAEGFWVPSSGEPPLTRLL